MPGDTDATHDLLFYDGYCALCHRWVKRVLEHDPDGRFRFAPLQGETLEQRLSQQQRNALPDSIVVLDPGGELRTRSAAVTYIVDRLDRPARLFWLTLPMRLPRPLADLLYRLVALIRRPVFGRTKEACPMLPPELRERFLP
jgi:predicted DCC family thiol-disulfide oxidoreductase YuxK